jgi:Short C-terminal domain
MPGLIRGVARTAVVAGTATAVSNRVSRRQASRWAAQDQYAYEQQPAYEPVPAPAQGPTTGDKIEQLKALGELKASGVLTDAEFEAQKAKILAG